ncbi:MAG: phenylacetate-CoA oxygenase/reductase subunit PaaK [Nitrococcus mobilis]|nr:phenylacetate-CoA oxygenase/reductase subunit PaaK [Nitrococcus mobilis]
MATFHELTIAELRPVTREAVAITFAVPPALREAFRYRQGQHIALRTRIAGAQVMRTYSICAGVPANTLRIAVKRQPHGVFSNFANDALEPGQTLEVMPPRGHFYTPLDPNQAKHYLAFAAGSGITPVLSIIETTLAVERASRFTLVYGNRTGASILFREELEDLKNTYMERFNLIHVLSRESADSELLQGRITEEKCAQLCERCIDIAGVDECFICGPEPMLHAVTAALHAHGIERQRIHFELFTIPGEVKRQFQQRRDETPGDHAVSRVAVIAEGRRLEFELAHDTETLLEAGLRAGADLPFSCKGGVCATCRAKLLTGEVQMAANYALEGDELKAGYVLTCQSYPLSKNIVLDYDA